MSKSDPFCLVYAKNEDKWERICMTETIYDTHRCKWVQKIPLEATDERLFKFEVRYLLTASYGGHRSNLLNSFTFLPNIYIKSFLGLKWDTPRF